MSCGNPVVEGSEPLMEKKSNFDRSTWCVKCKSARGNIVIRHTVYCKSCFSPFVTTKFRRCVEPYINESPKVSKRMALEAAGNLLVGFSGGLGSTVLLDLVSDTYFPPPASTGMNGKGGRSHPRNKRVWAKAYVCYVETCSAFPEGQMRDRSDDIRKFFMESKHFELIPARIEDAFDLGWWNKMVEAPLTKELTTTLVGEDLRLFFETLSHEQTSNDPISSLRAYLASLPTQTAVQSSISSLTRLILIYTARHLQCSHLALGTSLTSLSISLISAIAQGGGFNVREEYFEEWREPSNTGSGDDRTKTMSVRLVRPLHDVGMKECEAWAYWRELPIVGRERPPGMSGKQTIGSLTKSFIIGLERDYPSTVSTIVRTCSKVEAKDEVYGRCILCERAMPAGVLDWKNRISIRSRAEHGSPVISDEMKGHVQSDPFVTFLSSRLCYACHTHFTSKSSRSASSGAALVNLPRWTNAHLTKVSLPEPYLKEDEIWSTTAMNEEQMKAKVGEFLL